MMHDTLKSLLECYGGDTHTNTHVFLRLLFLFCFFEKLPYSPKKCMMKRGIGYEAKHCRCQASILHERFLTLTYWWKGTTENL